MKILHDPIMNELRTAQAIGVDRYAVLESVERLTPEGNLWQILEYDPGKSKRFIIVNSDTEEITKEVRV